MCVSVNILSGIKNHVVLVVLVPLEYVGYSFSVALERLSVRAIALLSDLTVPLNDTSAGEEAIHSSAPATTDASSGVGLLQSFKSARQRKYTVGSEAMEKDAKLKIDMDKSKKGLLKQERFARTYHCAILHRLDGWCMLAW